MMNVINVNQSAGRYYYSNDGKYHDYFVITQTLKFVNSDEDGHNALADEINRKEKDGYDMCYLYKSWDNIDLKIVTVRWCFKKSLMPDGQTNYSMNAYSEENDLPIRNKQLGSTIDMLQGSTAEKNFKYYLFSAIYTSISCDDEDAIFISPEYSLWADKFDIWLKENNDFQPWSSAWERENRDNYVVFGCDQASIFFANDVSVCPWIKQVFTSYRHSCINNIDLYKYEP